MKQPIEWHKECLLNIRAYALLKASEADLAKREAERLYRDVKMLQSQIIKAESEGKTSFDADKYMVKRKVA